MRRTAEIARHSIQGAGQALRAAQAAARQTLDLAGQLAIPQDEAAAISRAAKAHLERCVQAVAAAQAAMESAQTLMETVDRTETSRVGMPVLPAGKAARS
jgi:hypothetical protein